MRFCRGVAVGGGGRGGGARTLTEEAAPAILPPMTSTVTYGRSTSLSFAGGTAGLGACQSIASSALLKWYGRSPWSEGSIDPHSSCILSTVTGEVSGSHALSAESADMSMRGLRT